MSVDTIFAVASGAPPAALAIVRVSGPQAFLAARALAGLVPPNRTAALRTLRRPSTREALDHAIVIAFVGPQSATGEDIVEFHLHGGRAVVAVMLAALAEIPGLRAAEAGEFTRRALSNGRIDLAEAEGLADLLEAQTERQRRTAMRSVEGQLSAAVAGWTTRVLQLAARVEALLDFADEGDVGESLDPATVAQLASLVADIDRVLAAPPVERLRDGVRVVLAGPRNAGKSTLFNALVEREAAIVSPIAGTTRDIVETTVVRNGIAYAIADTAGLVDETDDVIEAIGIDRARAAMAGADIVLWLGDLPPPPAARSLWLYPQSDARPALVNPARMAVSARTGEGVAALWDTIGAHAPTLLPTEDQLALNARQRALCQRVRDALIQRSVEQDLLLLAENLRLARVALDEITGRADVESVLDALFARFCIGK